MVFLWLPFREAAHARDFRVPNISHLAPHQTATACLCPLTPQRDKVCTLFSSVERTPKWTSPPALNLKCLFFFFNSCQEKCMKALDCMVYKGQAASWKVTLLKIDAPKLGEELELLLGVKQTELPLEQFLVRMLTALTISDILDPTPFKTVYSILYFI